MAARFKSTVRGAGALPVIAFAMLIVACARTAPAGPVTLSIGAQQVHEKQDIVVPVQLKGASGLGALEFDLDFDPNVLEAGKLENGDLAAGAALESSASKPGRVRASLVSSGGITGDGPVALAHFTVRGASGAKSSLTLDNVRAWGVPKGHSAMPGMNHLIDVEAKLEPGELTVTGGWPLWMIAAIAGGAVVLLLLLLLVLVARRGGKKPATAAAAPGRMPAAAGTRFCTECGGALSPADKFCPNCGHRSAAL